MKQYQKISEEELVDKIIRAKNPSDIGYVLNHRERRIPFNEFWNINIDSLVSGFNQIDKIIQNIEYMNEELICDFCGNHFTRLERNASNKSGRHFCSNECGKKYANSFALTPQKRIALSHKMKDLYKQGKIKLPPKTKIEFFAYAYSFFLIIISTT